jgi:hypothetical protein
MVTSEGVFTGGDDTYKNLLTQEEYDRIQKIFVSELSQKARESIV